jgi:hypothetical protein
MHCFGEKMGGTNIKFRTDLLFFSELIIKVGPGAQKPKLACTPRKEDRLVMRAPQRLSAALASDVAEFSVEAVRGGASRTCTLSTSVAASQFRAVHAPVWQRESAVDIDDQYGSSSAAAGVVFVAALVASLGARAASLVAMQLSIQLLFAALSSRLHI